MDQSTSSGSHKSSLRLLFWELTAGCNLECLHCRRLEVSRSLMKEDLRIGECFEFLDALAKNHRPIIVLSGGEPLMRPDVFDIARYAAFLGMRVALATNGTLIDAPMAQRIRQAGIARVAISLDGASGEIHDRIRAMPRSFEKAVEGYRHLKSYGLSLQINTTLTKRNLHEKERIFELVRELDADAWHVFSLVPVGCGLKIADSDQLSPEEYEGFLGWLYELAKLERPFVRATCAPHFFRVMIQKSRVDADSESGRQVLRKIGFPSQGFHSLTKGCLAGESILFLSHKGDIFPCGYLPVSCGNIREKNFQEIWLGSPHLQRLRNPDLLEGKCGVCEFKRICLGCRARAFYQDGNYLSEEPCCGYEPRLLKVEPSRKGGDLSSS